MSRRPSDRLGKQAFFFFWRQIRIWRVLAGHENTDFIVVTVMLGVWRVCECLLCVCDALFLFICFAWDSAGEKFVLSGTIFGARHRGLLKTHTHAHTQMCTPTSLSTRSEDCSYLFESDGNRSVEVFASSRRAWSSPGQVEVIHRASSYPENIHSLSLSRIRDQATPTQKAALKQAYTWKRYAVETNPPISGVALDIRVSEIESPLWNGRFCSHLPLGSWNLHKKIQRCHCSDDKSSEMQKKKKKKMDFTCTPAIRC